MTPNWRGIRFGLGLLEIGKPWGARPQAVPDDEAAIELLNAAYRLGVRLYDTAASYARSEEKFGAFLRTLDGEARAGVTIATKFGEHWDVEKNEPYADHSYEALLRSLDRSLERLGRIDVLQVHKTTPEALGSEGLARALEEARRRGVTVLGASVGDLESAGIVLDDDRFGQVQLPYNLRDRRFAEVIEEATRRGKLVFTNRPLKMGELAGTPVRECVAPIRAMRFDGAILFGTRSIEHLRENWAAFTV